MEWSLYYIFREYHEEDKKEILYSVAKGVEYSEFKEKYVIENQLFDIIFGLIGYRQE